MNQWIGRRARGPPTGRGIDCRNTAVADQLAIHTDTRQQHQRRVEIHVVSVTSRRQTPDGRSSPHNDGLNVILQE